MLITAELLLRDNLRDSMLTVAELYTDTLPGLDSATGRYADQSATFPPGPWVRRYQGSEWLTRSVPGPAFVLFLKGWRGLPAVAAFLDAYGRFVMSSLQAIPDVVCNVWISQRREPVLAWRMDCPQAA
ncbi:hypothetical protein C3N85_22645 [Salmonella enterica subsp. enterica serovar Morehead]|nr:hypothetical protein [Salmonella enterica subsp. enterica serovar Kottbus]EEM2539593.1 hypothetical protein [Salmonella enterica subsp. enterica serovar Morehead]EHN5888481.1 hypothetical protein [Salmonella enterica subsp. enterica serovar Newport]